MMKIHQVVNFSMHGTTRPVLQIIQFLKCTSIRRSEGQKNKKISFLHIVAQDKHFQNWRWTGNLEDPYGGPKAALQMRLSQKATEERRSISSD